MTGAINSCLKFSVNDVDQIEIIISNLKNMENTINKTKFRSYRLKLMATWDFILSKS